MFVSKKPFILVCLLLLLVSRLFRNFPNSKIFLHLFYRNRGGTTFGRSRISLAHLVTVAVSYNFYQYSQNVMLYLKSEIILV